MKGGVLLGAQIVALALGAVLTQWKLLPRKLSSRLKPRRLLVLVLVFLVNVGLAVVAYRERAAEAERHAKLEAAQRQHSAGSTFVRIAKESSGVASLRAFEQAIPFLTRSAELFEKLNVPFESLSARAGIAWARESLAVSNASQRVWVHIDDGERLAACCKPSNGATSCQESDLYVRCAQVTDRRSWRLARREYGAVLKTFARIDRSGTPDSLDIPEAMISARRNMAYFLLCDRLMFHWGPLGAIRKSWRKLLSEGELNRLSITQGEASYKLRIINALKRKAASSPGGDVDMWSPRNIERTPLAYTHRLDKRPVTSIDMIVLHCTELPTLALAREWGEKLLYPSQTGNSGHYYIDKDGHVLQYVVDHRIAHHVRGYNDRSLGIELVNAGRYPNWHSSTSQKMTDEYPREQIESLIDLVRELRCTYPSIKYIARHEDLDATEVPSDDNQAILIRRKRDPGPKFPWDEVLEQSGLEPFRPAAGADQELGSSTEAVEDG